MLHPSPNGCSGANCVHASTTPCDANEIERFLTTDSAVAHVEASCATKNAYCDFLAHQVEACAINAPSLNWPNATTLKTSTADRLEALAKALKRCPGSSGSSDDGSMKIIIVVVALVVVAGIAAGLAFKARARGGRPPTPKATQIVPEVVAEVPTPLAPTKA